MSRVAQMAFLGAVPAAPAVLTYQGLTTSPNGDTVRTAAACPIGTPGTGRTVFCTVSWYNDTTARTLLSATIGGVAATIHAQNNSIYSTTAPNGVAIISAVVPTGTTADVVGTLSSGGSSTGYPMYVASYSATGLLSRTPGDTFSSARSSGSPSSFSETIDIVKDGILIVGYTPFWGTSTTLTGVTRDYNAVIGSSGGSWAITGGSLAVTADQAGRTITLSVSGSTRAACVGAAFR